MSINMRTNTLLSWSLVIIGTMFFVVSLSLIITSSWVVQTVSARDKVETKGLTLSPLRNELEIAPGTSLDGVLKVTNSTNRPMLVQLNAEEFSVINQQYDYAFTAESNVSKWVTFNPTEVNLAIGESKKVSFTVGVPLSAEPGGRYISLFASTNTAASDDNVPSRQRIASLLYITVLGDISRVGHLVSLSSPWLVGDKSTWSVALQNTGTTHFRSRYNVKVKNLLWDGTVAGMSGDALILPGTIRLIPDTLPLPQLPGVYKVIYTIGLGDTPSVTETRLSLYLPPWAIMIIVVIIIISALALKRRQKSRT